MTMYGSVAAADTYHTARGNTAWATADPTSKPGFLTRASDYVDSFRDSFSGRKTGGRAQEREWARTDATDASGEELPWDEVPKEVEYATYEAALLLAQGTPLSANPTATGSVTKKRVKAGPVESETEYAETTRTGRMLYSSVMSALEPILSQSFGSATIELLRV